MAGIGRQWAKPKVRTAIIAIIIGLLLAAISAVVWEGYGKRQAPPQAIDGTIDLSNWDFRKMGTVRLDGEWGFYPNRLLDPSDISGLRPEHYWHVPAGWSDSQTSAYMQDKGVGTYRLLVKINPEIKRYGIKTTFIRSSSVLFVDDTELGRSGEVSAQWDESYRGHNIPISAYFLPEGDSFYLTIQAANWDYFRGGIIQSIYLGTSEDIRSLALQMTLVDVVNAAFLLISSLYYLGIYLKRRQDIRFLFFALFCLGFSFVAISTSERVLMQLMPSIPYLLILRIKFVVILGGMYCLCVFIRRTEPAFMPLWCIRLAAGGWIVYSAISPFADMPLLDKTMTVMTLFELVGIQVLLLRAILLKRFGNSNARMAWQLLVSVLSLLVMMISMTLYLYSQIFTLLSHIVMQLLFLGMIALIFAEQYTRAYDELEVMSRKLVETDKLKDEFLIRTSHEFKTPLHGIMNLARVVRDQEDSHISRQQKENLSYIMSLSARLSTLVNDIIDFQHLREGRLVLKNSVFDMNGTIQATIDVLQHMKKEEEVRLINRVPSGEFYLFADENRFTQILVNLVGNALKFTDEGMVELRAEARGEAIAITISDTGAGMDADLQERLFHSESGMGDSVQMDNRPSGMGLQISKRLAVRMGGDLLLVESRLQRGTVFELVLPAASADQGRGLAKFVPDVELPEGQGILPIAPVAAGTTLAWEEEHKNKITLLLVDDEASNIKVLQECFPPDRYHTVTAYDGESALRLLQQHRDIAIVLLDVMMPGLSGYETCRRIREVYPIYSLPVLLLTVRHSPADIATGLDAGANDFLVKPFDARELYARVNTLLQLREAVKEAIQMESMFLQSQIKPHFIYNALSIIISLCYKDAERAGRLLGQFSNYLRLSFDLDPRQARVTLRREISLVKSYAELEQARFGDRLSVELEIDEGLLDFILPALTLQPLVENAIRHGLMKRAQGGVVRLEAGMQGSDLQIAIIDNGLGFMLDELEDFRHTGQVGKGVGLANVHKRLLNEYGRGLRIESREGFGAKVTILLPEGRVAIGEGGQQI
ncbi:ATP-binding protein [Paenibacillus sp. FSL H8-0537]|uniref:hybrid sensor histidine kinase/response regulator n=1 Tax=Paenibacillus sp. FSL H8-0537 TaxID=2921399 RepID=UPI003100B616